MTSHAVLIGDGAQAATSTFREGLGYLTVLIISIIITCKRVLCLHVHVCSTCLPYG